MFICIIFLFLHTKFQKKNIVEEPKIGILKIDLNGPLKEKYYSEQNIEGNFLKKIFNHNINIKKNSLFLLCKKIKQAKEDKNIKAILLNFENFGGGSQPALEYFGECLKKFKKSGKPIYSVGKNYSQAQYYLASFSNLIFLKKHGTIDFNGISIKNFYYKDILDKLHVNVHVFRTGKYKSAVEPITRNGPSEEIKKENLKIIHFLWKQYLKKISINRKIKIEKICPFLNKKIFKFKDIDEDMTKYAKNNRLVDYVLSNKNINNILRKKFSELTNNKRYKLINIYEYKLKLLNDNKKNEFPSIGIITNDGSILNDINNENAINISTTISKIQSAKKDKNIKALIFFINSPGGTLAESEKIRKSLNNFKKSKKPLIILMGGTTASGGYWISTAGDYIISSPTTITGSIGIFNYFYTLEKSLKSLGIYYDNTAISNFRDNNIFHDISPELKKFIKFHINMNYKKFLEIVAKSRHKSIEEIEKIAEGKIWTGYQAKKIGLVDQLGNLDDAIKKASEMTNLKNFHIKFIYTKKNTILSNFLFLKTNKFIEKRFFNIFQMYFPLFSKKNINSFKFNKDLIYIINNENKEYLYSLNNRNFIK
ncbi:MAG: signal peptide peptidase SppA [Buchnera aphidicola (Periphyllus acericola)]|uniref:signal peptide peptidase SppA n=1 Tax=Buchnera aphidicola TaxID=9 RepID=UPI0030D11C98|nr:signal peptide peptidase SppA [Buchnera aphidicola (Periphyllus acericola)]